MKMEWKRFAIHFDLLLLAMAIVVIIIATLARFSWI
jgi:hypothetical protein